MKQLAPDPEFTVGNNTKLLHVRTFVCRTASSLVALTQTKCFTIKCDFEVTQATKFWTAFNGRFDNILLACAGYMYVYAYAYDDLYAIHSGTWLWKLKTRELFRSIMYTHNVKSMHVPRAHSSKYIVRGVDRKAGCLEGLRYLRNHAVISSPRYVGKFANFTPCIGTKKKKYHQNLGKIANFKSWLGKIAKFS